MTDMDGHRGNSGHGGIYAILVVIIILLIGGFLYFTRYAADDGPDIRLEVPQPEGTDVDIDAPDVEMPEPGGGGDAGGDAGTT